MKAQVDELNKFAQETSSDAIHVSCTPCQNSIYRANLWDFIETGSQFSTILAALDDMEEGDRFILNLQSGGGDLGITDSLIHSMRKCKGHIHIVATGYNASAATIILLEAHTFELSAGFTALIHCGALGGEGTLSEIKQWAKFYPDYMAKMLRNAYKGFLTEDEIDVMLDGKDIMIDADGWRERYAARQQYLTAPAPRTRRKKSVAN